MDALDRDRWLGDPAYRQEYRAAALAEYSTRTATTPGDNLPYPDDWLAPAATPSALQALAEATQAGLNRRPQAGDVWGDWSQIVTDWNQATKPNQQYRGDGAANAPSQQVNTWHGMVVAKAAPDYLVQLAWPFGVEYVGVSSAAPFVRSYRQGQWGNWARLTNFVHAFGSLDGLVSYRLADITRFSAGLKQGTGNGAPAPSDAWRVQCYDTAGNYTFTAIQIGTDGVVTFPRGHTLRGAPTPMPRDSAATLGDVIDIITEALQAAGIDPGTIRSAMPALAAPADLTPAREG